tara:strand:- start:221 stop:1642 length:1422 start_codon:yes stop_codon:yes gene_type:complete
MHILKLTILNALLLAIVSSQSFEDLSQKVQSFVKISDSEFVINNVRLIDGTGSLTQEDMSVIVKKGRIVSISKTNDIKHRSITKVIDGRGHTLIPGLVMLHEHMFYPSGEGRYNTNQVSFPPLYLAGGATTIRTGGSVDTYTDLAISREISAGNIAGPDIDVTAPYLEGPGAFLYAMPIISTPKEARNHVNFWADLGATSFKAYNWIDRKSLKSAIRAAHQRGLKVTGHLCSITYREAADMGIDNLEHGFYAATDWVLNKKLDECPRGEDTRILDIDLNGSEFIELVDHLISRDVALTSTLAVLERWAPDRKPPPKGAHESILPQLQERYKENLKRRVESSGEKGTKLLNRYMAMEKAFYDAGGLLVAGTDPTGAGDVIPGYANQRTVQLLIEMGLSIEEAVKVCTYNGALYLERDGEIGTIEQGKRADMILIKGNPSVDIEAFRQMTIVFKNGIGYDSQKLFESVKGWVGVR